MPNRLHIQRRLLTPSYNQIKRVDYVGSTDSNPAATSVNNTWSLPDPIQGQKLFWIMVSEEALSGGAFSGGNASGFFVRATDTYTNDFVYCFEAQGKEVKSLDTTGNFGASCTFWTGHLWRTVGYNFSSMVSGGQAASDQVSTVLSVTKPAGDLCLFGSRKYITMAGTPTPSVDFANASVCCGRMNDTAAFSGNITFATTTTATLKWGAAVVLTPSG